MKICRLRLLGHPVHPMLTAFPIGLWGSSVLWDGVALVRSETIWSQMAFGSLALGLVLFVPTAITGFLDFLALSDHDPVLRVATRHMLTSVGAASFFAISLLARRFQASPTDIWLALSLSIAGLVLLMVAGWLGGELVFGHGVAVERTTDESHSTPTPPI